MGSLNPENEPKPEFDDSGYVQEDAATIEVSIGVQGKPAPCLLDLSNEVLLYILKFCSPRDLKALGFTCPRLGTLVLDRTLWRSVEARAAPSGSRRVRWLLTHALSSHTAALRLAGYAREAKGCLGFMSGGRDEDGPVDGPWEHHEPDPMVHDLSSSHLFRLSSQALPRYGGGFPFWPDQAPRPIGHFRPREPKKPETTGHCCPGPQLTLSHAALLRLNALCTNLKELALDYCVIDCNLTKIAMFPVTLKKLSLRGTKCFNLEKSFLYKIQDRLIYLEDLDVSECEWIEPACMLPLSKMPCLSRLAMRECGKLSEFVAYASLATRYGFKTLKILDLRGSPVGDSEVSALGWVPGLEQLFLSPAPAAPRHADHAHFSRDPLPEHTELEPWEEQEPDYYNSKYAAEEWIAEEGNDRNRRNVNPNDDSALGSCVLLQHVASGPEEQRRIAIELNRSSDSYHKAVQANQQNNGLHQIGPNQPENGPNASNQPEDGPNASTQSQNGPNASNQSQNGPNASNQSQNGLNASNQPQNGPNQPPNHPENGPSASNQPENGPSASNQPENGPNEGPSNSQGGSNVPQPTVRKKPSGFHVKPRATEELEYCRRTINMYPDMDDGRNNKRERVNGEDDSPNKRFRGSNHSDDSAGTSKLEPCVTKASRKFYDNTCQVSRELLKGSINDFMRRTNSADSINYRAFHNNVSPGYTSSEASDDDEDIDNEPQPKRVAINDGASTSKSNQEQSDPNKPSTSKNGSDENEVQSSEETVDEPNESNHSNASSHSDSSSHSNELSDPTKPIVFVVGSIGDSNNRDSWMNDLVPMNQNDASNDARESNDSVNDSNGERQKYVRFRHNEPPVVVDGSNPSVSVYNENSNVCNNNDVQEPDWNESSPQRMQVDIDVENEVNLNEEAAANGVEDAGNANANDPGNANGNPNVSRHRILYVNVGRRRHAMYQLSMPEPIDPNTRRPISSPHMNLLYSSNIAPRLEYTSLVTDAAIRRFGRADGENINYVQIGPRGPVPAPYDDPHARPNRSNLRVLSVTGFRHITNYSLLHLATAAPHLESIDFTGTRVTEAGVEHFRNMRPDCRVRYGPVGTPKEDSGRPHSR